MGDQVAGFGRIYLANVGVNAAHRLRSPLFPDGTFEFVPIPEEPGCACPPMLRYGDLPCFNDPETPLARYLPCSARNTYTHADPEFVSFSYGDNCDRSPRAAALRRVVPGDLVCFLARLVPWHEGRFVGLPGFFLVGYLDVAEVVPRVTARPLDEVLDRIDNNAHVRRGLACADGFDGFWVFRGSPASARFRRAVPVSRELAETLFTTAKGETWRWDGRSELQVIGSYTRTCRCIIDPSVGDGLARAARLWQAVKAANPDLTAAAGHARPL